MNIGIIGCGNISPLYLKAASHFEAIRFLACSDLDMEAAKTRAQEFGIEALTVSKLLAHPDIELIVNLTVPSAHAAVARSALEAGKHVYNEKPLATELSDAKAIMTLAARHNLRLACAPSTFLGAAVQSARKAIDDGLIGEPVAAHAAMLSRGMEHWHPNPEFFYQPGAGPMFDIGPYYLSALLTLLGPVTRVTGSARISFPERTIRAKARAGERFPVTTPTHISGVLDFAEGPIANLTTSFDVWSSELPKFEIYGSEGTLSLKAPNMFDGPVRVRRDSDSEWRTLPLANPYQDMERGWGVALADLAQSVQQARPHRASAELGYHALEIMHAFLRAPEEGKHIAIHSRCTRPESLLEAVGKGTSDKAQV